MVSAALASASVLTRPIYPEKADLYLRTARALYRWAADKPGLFAKTYDGYPEWLYGTSYYNDKLMLAAGWLFRATGNSTYLDAAHRHWLAAGGRKGHRDKWGGEVNPYISWDSLYGPAAVNLLRIAQRRGAAAVPGHREYERFVDDVAEIWRRTGKWSLEHTPYGLRYARWSKWGNLRYAANVAFTMLLRAQTLPPGSRDRIALVKFARVQVDYCMGATGRSFIVGFGRSPPRRVHHAAASCPDLPANCTWKQFETSAPNPQVLTGALVGGPAGPGDDTYTDRRDDFETNEVSIDYNAGLTAAVAGLLALEPDCCTASTLT
ncbi:hypothetical protein COHA_009798 [Chlorella ohadii]|uniref:Endoglucanase n=1 Tax=Chlorella ohadii TaxID=2649997 RepID=A0AAD5DL26_9CHLO|nr:hypothetical protein COHA_009798 [Chlorella ohadii]